MAPVHVSREVQRTTQNATLPLPICCLCFPLQQHNRKETKKNRLVAVASGMACVRRVDSDPCMPQLLLALDAAIDSFSFVGHSVGKNPFPKIKPLSPLEHLLDPPPQQSPLFRFIGW